MYGFPIGDILACIVYVANAYIYFCIHISTSLIVCIDIFCIFSYISFKILKSIYDSHYLPVHFCCDTQNYHQINNTSYLFLIWKNSNLCVLWSPWPHNSLEHRSFHYAVNTETETSYGDYRNTENQGLRQR